MYVIGLNFSRETSQVFFVSLLTFAVESNETEATKNIARK